jgi:ceramide glucosyltransferase
VQWFWVLGGAAILLAVVSLRGERKRFRRWKTALGERSLDELLPPATVIVPVKGADERLRENLHSLAALDYPDYELIVAARRPGDIPAGVVPAGARVVFPAGGNSRASEKVRNLAAAVAEARPASRIFAFADSDARVQPGWLRALAGPLADTDVGAVTGYRWYLPERGGFWSLLRSVWNSVSLEPFLAASPEFVWGGSMAITRATFDCLRIDQEWEVAISDDYSVAAAIRQAGLQIVFHPGALALARDHTGGHAFFAFAVRQMRLTRFYRPALWAAALIGTAIYCGSMAACGIAAATGRPDGAGVLLLQLALGMWKGRNRASLAASALPAYRRAFADQRWAHVWLVPLSTWIWLAALLASACGDSIEWRGVRYVLRSAKRA